jgi:hypothetical protein
VSGADLVGDVSEDDGDDCATADGGDEEGCTTLGVASETAESWGMLVGCSETLERK